VAMYSMAGLAEYAVVPATDVFPLPASLPLEESAVLGCAVFTAFGAVRHAADLKGGERVAVVAAGGLPVPSALSALREKRSSGDLPNDTASAGGQSAAASRGVSFCR